MKDLKEFRERLIERYEPSELVELLGLSTEEVYYAFDLKLQEVEEIWEELGFGELNDVDG